MPNVEKDKQLARAAIMHLTDIQIIDSLHEELITGLEEAEISDFGSAQKNRAQSDTTIGKFLAYSTAYSTAGVIARNITMILASIAETVRDEDPSLAEQCLIAQASFQEKFNTMVEYVRSGLTLANHIGGEEAVADVHGLMVVLPPSKYRHLEQFIAHKYGPDKATPMGKNGPSKESSRGSK